MQFLWKYVDDMVGKGIEMYILAELFFYAAMTFVPQAMPLAILFASLMTFGNLGEQLELLAMKSSGISLIRIMKPLIIFLIFTSIAVFFFQNNLIPVSKVKFYTILFSVKIKSPELEIPERTFCYVLKGRNLYVKQKDKKRQLMKDIMIYDYQEGFNNARIIVADSGRLKSSIDKKYLVMTLYSGESFENVKGNKNRARDAKDPVPYRRATFDTMEMLIEYDANFDRKDESIYSDRFIGKNIAELKHSIDSMTVRLDSIKELESKTLFAQSYKKTIFGTLKVEPTATPPPSGENSSSTEQAAAVAPAVPTIDFDSLCSAQPDDIKASLFGQSKRNIENLQMNYMMKASLLKSEDKEIRWHHTEMHSKFTLSFACLIFFFIGAPLGAIIRKGGLGAPAVISVLLFVIYYIIDSLGYKMARDAVWLPWQGMWLSSAVLLPLGIFLTYKAVNDSVILNAETYIDPLKRFFGAKEMRKIDKKEFIIEATDYKDVAAKLQSLKSDCAEYFKTNGKLSYISLWRQGGIDAASRRIAEEIESVVYLLSNSDNNLILNKTMDFPVVNSFLLFNFPVSHRAGMVTAALFPVGGLLWLLAIYRRKLIRNDISATSKVCDEMMNIINTTIN
jgi:lipopolysaccharide export system permease protein